MHDYTLEITSTPTIPDQWLGRAKHSLRVEATETYDDSFISELLEDAAEHVGELSNLSLLATTYRLTLPRFPRSALYPIYLPRPPLVSVSSVQYVDTAGTSQAFDFATNCDVIAGQLSVVQCKPGQSWPVPLCPREDAVQITFIAGNATPARAAVRAIMLLVGHWYLNREETHEKRLSNIPNGVESLIQQIRPGDEFRFPIMDSLNHEDQYPVRPY